MNKNVEELHILLAYQILQNSYEQISSGIVFYICIPNFKTLGLIIKNFEVFAEGPVNLLVLCGFLTGQVKLLKQLLITPANDTLWKFQILIWYTMYQRRPAGTRGLSLSIGETSAWSSIACKVASVSTLFRVL